MPHIQVRGFNHYYEWITETAEPSGKPVMVFLHGWGGSCRYWESTARAIADRFDCLLYDMRGFGRSQLAEKSAAPLEATDISYELESYAEDLEALLAALGLDRVCLNAHSTGSSIAVFFLNLYPERVDRAILTCSGIFTYDEKSFKAFHQFGGYVVKFRPRWLYQLPGVDRLFMQRFLHRPIPRTESRAFLNDFLLADYDAAVGTMMTAVSEKAAQVMPMEFARLSVPTLLISGQYDLIIPAEMGRQAASLNDRIQYTVMLGTAHFPMLEDAPTYLQQINPFLAAETARSSEAIG